MNLHQTLAGCETNRQDLRESAKLILAPYLKTPPTNLTVFHAAMLMSYDAGTRQAYINKYGEERCRLFDAIVYEALGILNDKPNNQLGTIIQNVCSIF